MHAFEMRCYRKIMKINWKDMVRNEQIRKELQREETVVDKVKRRKLKLFEHICRMGDNRLMKTVIPGRAEGVRRRGIPRRRWLEWTTSRSGLR